jgi:hypothetical protein
LPVQGQDKRIGICIVLFWAHFRPKAPETGLSAPIPHPACGGPPVFPLQSLARFRQFAKQIAWKSFFSAMTAVNRRQTILCVYPVAAIQSIKFHIKIGKFNLKMVKL